MEQPWEDGYWLFEDMKFIAKEIRGSKSNYSKKWVEFDHPELKVEPSNGTWTLGDFGETPPEIKEATDVEKYNLEMAWMKKWTQKGVLSKDGKMVTCIGAFGMTTGQWLSPEDLQKFLDGREDINDLSCPYPKQPDNQGKILWLSGPPGAGKSSTAQFMGKNHGYVYFEGDTFLSFVNPYLPLDVQEPSLELRNQKPLKGYSLETAQALLKGITEWSELLKFADHDTQAIIEFYKVMANFVLKEKTKIGGNFVVAQAVPTKQMRDAIKEILGDQCIFVTLQLAEETNAKRVDNRFKGKVTDEVKKMFSEMCNKMYKLFEPAKPDEKNAVNVEIGPDMDIDEVTQTILSKTT